MVDGSRPLFSAVSVHEGQEVYGSTPVSYQSLRKGVLEVFQEVGLPVQKFGLHSLRAGGVTLAANSGVPDRLWMEHGGWRSLARPPPRRQIECASHLDMACPNPNQCSRTGENRDVKGL